MAAFEQEISDFQRYGIYTYEFDASGNLIFNSSSAEFSQVYLSLPLQNVIYNNVKIASFYTTDFEEFVPTTGSTLPTSSAAELQTQLSTVQQENSALKDQLDALIGQNESNSSAADQQAAKQVVLELRKALGQGRVDSDFSDTFPYTPIKKPASQAA